ncbi:Protein F45E4.11 [Aphelenchoides avenae]|nr:Protein F45E4.11 [Aphelenchus avenae]
MVKMGKRSVVLTGYGTAADGTPISPVPRRKNGTVCSPNLPSTMATERTARTKMTNRLNPFRIDCHPEHSPIFRIGLLPEPTVIGKDSSLYSSYFTGSKPSSDSGSETHSTKTPGLFPSMRLLLAVLLCCCYITISISTSNMAVALICMIKCPLHEYAGDLEWHSDQEGLVLAAQNAGSLLMLFTGLYADRVNGKWMVGAALALCFLGNVMLPLLAAESFWYAVLARIAIGASDACMSPAVNSLITRWFPQAERAAAIGIITGGRQIGTLFILPTAGYLCTRTDVQGGWPAIFYLSGLISGMVVVFWLPMGADKPSKQYCISNRERLFIESRIACESIGKRTHARRIPWRNLLTSTPLWVGVFSLVCHEYPLVIMLQFLPNYMRDVLEFAPTKNGFLSALPIFFLFLSKTISASLSSWMTVHTKYNSTKICKIFNGVASAGLALSILAVPQCKNSALWSIVALCIAMMFAGLHTPGVVTALLQLAPPFSGVITGISFFAVAWFSIGNKILTKWIVQQGTQEEWAVVFYISATVAALPVVVFSVWGSDERQWWAAPSSKASVNQMVQNPSAATLSQLKV